MGIFQVAQPRGLLISLRVSTAGILERVEEAKEMVSRTHARPPGENYWVGKKVHSGSSITSYGKNQMNLLANPINITHNKTAVSPAAFYF